MTRDPAGLNSREWWPPLRLSQRRGYPEHFEGGYSRTLSVKVLRDISLERDYD